jgi:uncharacterized RDD family membrane protein YckC
VELDDRLTLPGAEGIDLDLVLGGIGSRGVALLLDTLIETIALLLLAWFAGAFDELAVLVFSIGSFMVVLGYPICMEAFNDGRTVGKLAMGLSVLRSDGTPVTFLAATIRNVTRIVDLLPGVYFVGIVSMLVSPRNQRLGDLAAGTIVVRTRGTAIVGGGNAWATSAPAPASMPPEVATWDTSALSAEEVAAVRTFLDRRSTLAAEHRGSIADGLARQVAPKVAGIPYDGGPELFLERIAYARSFR